MILEEPALLPVPVALLLGLTLVVQLLALAERQFELRPALIVEIDLERNERHAFAIDRRSAAG